MTETLLALVPEYGAWLLALCAFLSSMALPVPSSVLLLAAGGFVAAGDLSPGPTAGAALAGALAGDQIAYLVGRRAATPILHRLGPRTRAALDQAAGFLGRRGGIAVFLSRWLVSALGPYVTFAAGMAGLGWLRFTLWSLAGMMIWIGLYLGLGYGLGGNLEAASAIALKLLALLASAAVALGLALWLWRSREG